MTVKKSISVFIITTALAACAQIPSTLAPLVAGSNAPQRLFLQQLGSQSVIIKWRPIKVSDDEVSSESYACVASAVQGIETARCETAVLTEADHQEVLVANLKADTEYLYSVDGYAAASLRFRTAPAKGNSPNDGNVHIWVLGDSGTASVNHKGKAAYGDKSAQVMAGYQHYQKTSGSKPADMVLMLGDNAYTEGTDEQWQLAVFDVFGDVLRQAPLWSTIGNHEMGAGVIDVSLLDAKTAKQLGKTSGELVIGGVSTSSDPYSFVSADNRTPRLMPYLDILSLPANGELGGAPSGTEQYYSFDYGNVHVVSLDSQLSARDELQREAMKQWLEADLQTNELDWTIAIFHHPVYTKGSHDSDAAAASKYGIDQPILDLRAEFTPVFEEYGVDITFSGHSHTYERSWYIHGHRGDAATFSASEHAELNNKGEPAIGHGEEEYHQISVGSQRDDKVVYTVAGSSGHMKMGHGKLDHPAHAVQQHDPEKRHGLAEMGSVVVDATADSLTARFINEKGTVLDTVVINK